MDIDDLKYFKREETPIEKLNKELFNSTSEYKYYNFGVASVMVNFYKMFKDLGDNKVSGNELVEIIKISADDNEDIHNYFNKLKR